MPENTINGKISNDNPFFRLSKSYSVRIRTHRPLKAVSSIVYKSWLLVFIIQFLSDKIYSYTQKRHLVLGNLVRSVNFTIQNLKCKHLVCLSFSGERQNLRRLRGLIFQKVWALKFLSFFHLEKKYNSYNFFWPYLISIPNFF